MRILHISDTHGQFPQLFGNFDIVVHSGDFFPDPPNLLNRNKTNNMVWQLDWLKNNVYQIKSWLKDTQLLFTLGNHDFIHASLMEDVLNSSTIKATSLHEEIISYNDYNFYGFPWIPEIGDNIFNYEVSIPEMQHHVDEMVKNLNTTYVDVVVAHAPLYGYLDLTYGNERIGSTVIANAFNYKLDHNMMPAAYLHGHVHENFGISSLNSMIISNAARTMQVIEI